MPSGPYCPGNRLPIIGRGLGKRSSGRAAAPYPPPPSRRAGCQRRVRSSVGFLRTPKPLTDPALPADRSKSCSGNRPLPTLGPQMYDFWLTFRRSKIHQKSDSSKTFPKSQKSDPRAPNVGFLMDFGAILGAIFDEMFKLFRKTPKARFY